MKELTLPLQPDGKDVEQIQHFPSQKEDGNEYNHHGQQFPEAQAAARGLEAPGGQAEDVEGGESEHNRPEDVVNVLPSAAVQQSSRDAGKNSGLQTGIDTRRRADHKRPSSTGKT